jgi:hypothetical protein
VGNMSISTLDANCGLSAVSVAAVRQLLPLSSVVSSALWDCVACPVVA